MENISRKDAKRLRRKFYFTGVPCSRGHVARRRTKDRSCSECERVKNKEYYHKNKERRDAEYKDWLSANREKRKEYCRKWREKNKAWAKKYQLMYVANNKELINQRRREFIKTHREEINALNRNRRAKYIGANGSHTGQDIKNMFVKQNGLCAGCLASLSETKHHVDHVVPISKGGANWPENLQLLCPTCNSKKSDKMPDEWAAHLMRSFLDALRASSGGFNVLKSI